LGGNEIVGKISASTCLFSQSFHAPADREGFEIVFRRKAFGITWTFVICTEFWIPAFAKTRIGLIQTFVPSFSFNCPLSQAVFRRTCAMKSFSSGFWSRSISPFTTVTRPRYAFVSIKKMVRLEMTKWSMFPYGEGRSWKTRKRSSRPSASPRLTLHLSHRVSRAVLP
jgi:hypothetical protein